ncbi:DUF6471 domain-containing protein [Thiomonas sp. X19]|uniref:DUF6471 domain-containing protein n=1 Tax=Thiomonas sp. X19 TaxID=1050370 RepID=UPI000DDB5243|nr:DUF6471 domain-containing protein [Thiomonas sp. X19]
MADTSQVWEREARRILKALMARQECSAKQLSRLLQAEGLEIEPKALSNRINRGTFPFAFFLQAAKALGVDSVDVRRVGPRRSSLGAK